MIIYSYNLRIQTKDKIIEEQKIKVSNCFVSSNLLEFHSRYNLITNLNFQNSLCIAENTKFLELFFIDINGSCLLNTLLLSNNITPNIASIRKITSFLESYDCVELFSILLSNITNTTQPSIIKHILHSKDKFYAYLQGAKLSCETKWELWNIYIFSGFENYKETGVNKLGKMLANLINTMAKQASKALISHPK